MNSIDTHLSNLDWFLFHLEAAVFQLAFVACLVIVSAAFVVGAIGALMKSGKVKPDPFVSPPLPPPK